jgi:hypothetical protein
MRGCGFGLIGVVVFLTQATIAFAQHTGPAIGGCPVFPPDNNVDQATAD